MTVAQNRLCWLVGKLVPPVRVGAEIGIHCGHTSAVLLQRFPDLHLHMVDSWTVYADGHHYRQVHDPMAFYTQEEQDDNRRAAVAAVSFASGRFSLWHAESVAAASRIDDASLDFVYIDAAHSYEGVTSDLAAWWPKVRPGGLFSGHDYANRCDHKGGLGVKRAVDEFVSATLPQQGVVNVTRGAVWYVHKP